MTIRRKKIKALVDALLNENNIIDAPVPVAEIARSQGARIVFDRLEGDMSGFIYSDANQTVIGVNTVHAKTRQHFTIAHECGHLLLHEQEQMHVDHEFRVRLRDDVSSRGTDDAEREANLFAASLLMPKEFLDKDLEKEHYVDVLDDLLLRRLARKYGVSTQALVNRLKNLGYIQE